MNRSQGGFFFRARVWWVVLVVTPTVVGCGETLDLDQGEIRWDGRIDTLPNGLVLVRNGSRGVWPERARWLIREEWRIGAVSSEGPESFGHIVSFAVDDSGRVWVLDGQAGELRLYDSNGDHIRTVGRIGSGPGEFRQPVRVDIGPDGLVWVVDPGNARISRFDSTGSNIDEIRIPGGLLIMPWPGGFDVAGRYYAPVRGSGRGSRHRLVQFDRALAPLDTIHLPTDPVERDAFAIVTDGRPPFSVPIPFQGGLAWRLSSSGTVWVLIMDQYRLFELDSEGDTLLQVWKTIDPVPVTGEEKAQVLQDLKWFSDQGGTVDPSRIPDHKPGVRGFFVDGDGHLWVARESPDRAEGSVHDIFGPSGRYLGAVAAPFTLRMFPSPVVRGDVLYGVVLDEFDVEYLVRSRVVKP